MELPRTRPAALLAVSVVLAVLVNAAVVVGLEGAARAIGTWTALEDAARLTTGPQATIVYDRHGEPVFTFFEEQRTDVRLQDVSPHLVRAVLAAEDRRYFQHRGFDPARIVAAAVRNLRATRIVQGGSTITQQLARAIALTPERTFERKLREAFVAAQLERDYSKQEILESYLNLVYLGQGYHGVEAAARGYFGKPASELDVSEAATIAGLIRAPSRTDPRTAPERARLRRDLVLGAMRREGWLSEAEYRRSVSRGLRVRAEGLLVAHEQERRHEPGTFCGLFFKDEVRRQVSRLVNPGRLLRDGLRIYATIDPRLQLEAELAIERRIARLEAAGRRSRSRDAAVEGGLVALDPATGEVLALVGGRDFHASPFNRATLAKRQPGSAFKPIVVAAAVQAGFGPGTLLEHLDTPIGAIGTQWVPRDAHAGVSTLREAVVKSSNRAAVQLLEQVGLPSALDMARRLGIASKLPAVPSLALGSGEVTLLELTAAYTAFAAEGMVAAPVVIRRIEDRGGRVLWQARTERRRVLGRATAFLVSSMLADVVDRGTAAGARSLGFRLPAGGKTGTSNDFTDAWFIGYTPRLVAGVWFGRDRPTTIAHEGFASVVAVPAWADFMKRATAGHPKAWYEQPPDVERVPLCRWSGLRATPSCWVPPRFAAVANPFAPADPWDAGAMDLPPVYEDLFASGTAPLEHCAHGLQDLRGEALPEWQEGTSGQPELAPPPRRRVVVERKVMPDGRIHTTIRQD